MPVPVIYSAQPICYVSSIAGWIAAIQQFEAEIYVLLNEAFDYAFHNYGGVSALVCTFCYVWIDQ